MLEIVELTLPDGQTLWAEIETAGSGPSDVGLRDSAKAVHGMLEAVRGVASNLHEGLRDAAPDRVRLEFAVKLAVAEVGIVAAVAGLSGNATFKVTAEWTTGSPNRSR